MSEKKKLVVIGNGMAGARTVEEILQRGGAAQYDISIIGDEPHGNYNRILLSNVLERRRSLRLRSYLNPLAWYRDNRDRAARAGARDAESIAPPRSSRCLDWAAQADAEAITLPYDTLIIATGSRPIYVPEDGRA